MLDGVVNMYYRENDEDKSVTLEPGDIFFAGTGCERVVHPRGQARVLVVAREESV